MISKLFWGFTEKQIEIHTFMPMLLNVMKHLDAYSSLFSLNWAASESVQVIYS